MNIQKIVMNVLKRFGYASAFLLLIGLSSCDKETTTENTTGTGDIKNGITFTQAGALKLSINHMFGDTQLALAPVTYITLANDTVRVSELSYYVSNIILTTANGTKVPVGAYYLENFLPGVSNTIAISNIPAGNYTNIEYMVGVDSLANSTGQHQGDLDPSYGMYWTWNTGYVFFRLKGRYSTDNNSYSFDIGGDQNTMKISHSLTTYKLSGTTALVGLKFDLAKVYSSPNIYDLKVNNNNIHSPGDAGIVELKANIKSALSLISVR